MSTDPNELYAVPISEQLDSDPDDDAHHGGEPDDLSDAPEGDSSSIVYFEE
jgi:hypothetical protein